MRRFFFFGSSAANTGNGGGTPGDDDTRSKKKTLHGDGSNGSSSSGSNSPATRVCRSRSRRGKLKNEEPSHPKQLRRSMSFSSPAGDNCFKDRSFSFSGDIPRSLFNESDVPNHAGDANCYAWSPERRPVSREYKIKVPKAQSVLQNDSPGSRCYSCSTGHSPVSSPIAIRCRSTRLTNLLSNNEVLDRYIDGEQEATILSERQKQYSPTRSVISNLGRPPRPQSTVPSVPRLTKEIPETYPSEDVKDGHLHQLAQEDTRETCKITTLCNASRNHAVLPDAFERFSHLEDYKSERVTSVEDIYEDMQEMQPPDFIFSSSEPISDDAETDGRLLQRSKEVEAKFIAPSEETYELNMSKYKRLSANDMLQMIQCLTEDRRQLAYELSSQIKARLTERFAAKEQFRQTKKELDIRTRRLEKEKSDVQITLEKEMDRRSDDWSVKLSRFQCEEERLRDRVRELAEQNVSFQREVTFLEAKRVDASDKVSCLEMEIKKLNDELEKVRNDHDNLQKSSVDLHARFTKVVEEKDHLREFFEDKDGENKALYKVIARLQTICNEQERTISGLRQGYIAELDKKSVECGNEKKSRMKMELIRLTGVEQKLRGEVQSCHLEVESLRQENITLLNRIQNAGNGPRLSSIRLDQELQARVDNLQTHGLSLLDKTSQLCIKLLDLMKCKRRENEVDNGIAALTVTDYTLEFQSIKGRIQNLKQSLWTINSILTEKETTKEGSGEIVVGSSVSREHKDGRLPLDNPELKLKEEAMLNRVLKEAILSKEFHIEQLESDLASSLRGQDVMRNEIQRVQDELSCMNHKAKHLEIQGLKKDETISQAQLDFQESAKELSSLRGTLKTVTDERDLLWQEAKQMRKTITAMQNETSSLKKKIEALEEDILVKEGQISILQDNISNPQLDFICSPRSMKEFDMDENCTEKRF
ncbi:paramyosin-like isoform X2 [Oryza brachyantha]|uniref:paramyosin-like isoform X2 n=1 Tax=Oryza brachyantha TaxID=4533 RepID=UPI0003EACCB8|nr:paramyosin-like isoform X2 [Oryza brachyantha]